MKTQLVILIALFCMISVACSVDEETTQVILPPTEETKSQDIATPAEETKAQVITPTIEITDNPAEHQTIFFDDLEREYFLYVPKSYTGNDPVPLLFSYHGYTATAEQLIAYTDLFSIADREGFILIYPQGSLLEGETHWNVGGWTNRSTTDDVGFTGAMIDSLSAEFNIDLGRVYAIGHSNGGFMSLRLACELSEKIAAIVSLSGSMTPETLDSCNPVRPVPVLQFHGTADDTVPYDGAYWSLSIDEMLEYWVMANECEHLAVISEFPHNPNTTSETSVEHIQFVGCSNGITVEHYKHVGGGHDWLGTPDDFGQINVDLNTNDEIWAFLSRYRLDGVIE